MLKWCAYCQHFIGECEPFDEYLISHGVCHACAPKVLDFSADDRQALGGVQAFFAALQASARDQRALDLGFVLEESRRLAVRPLDLMMGVFQPLLHEIGALWADGKVTVAMEQRFSALVDDWLAAQRLRAAEGAAAEPGRPSLILLNAEGNHHRFGLQMAESFFSALAIPCLTVTQGLPLDEILALLDQHRPQALGFSVALPGQMKQVLEVAEAAKALPVPPRHILVGGPAVRQGQCGAPGPGIHACRELTEILPFLQQPSPAGACTPHGGALAHGAGPRMAIS